jgi:HPt (histidine-containing phosphotransfer) domain-containing protein
MNDLESRQGKWHVPGGKLFAPLHSALRAAELLAGTTGLDEAQRRHVEAIRASVQSLLDLIEETEDTRNPGDAARDDSRAGVDLDVLLRLRGFSGKGRAGLFEELIFGFLEQTACKLKEIEQFMRDGDQPRMVQTAHTLKGMSLNLGALEMAKECETFQRLSEAGSGRDPELYPGLDRIKDAFSSAQRVLIRFAKQTDDAA